MALGGRPEKLVVGAADAVAKTRRAAEASSVRTVVIDAIATDDEGVGEILERTKSGAKDTGIVDNDGDGVDDYKYGRRFTTAPPDMPLEGVDDGKGDDASQGVFAAIIAQITGQSASTAKTGTLGEAGPADALSPASRRKRREAIAKDAPIQKMLREKVLPVLEKVAETVSKKLPDPTLLVLLLVLCLLAIHSSRPALLQSTRAKIGAIAVFVLVFPLVLVWQKTKLFSSLKLGGNPFVHPAEDTMDDMEQDLKEREEAIAASTKALAKNRERLDVLKKELFKDHAENEGIVTPNRKALAMIADGALGPTVDRETTEAVEARRKEETRLRSQQQWKQKTGETDGEAAETKESLIRLVNHASTVYPARTRELRNRSGAGGAFGPAGLRRMAHQHLPGMNHHKTSGTGGSLPETPSGKTLVSTSTVGTDIHGSALPHIQYDPDFVGGENALSSAQPPRAKSAMAGSAVAPQSVPSVPSVASEDHAGARKSKKSLFRRKRKEAN